MIQSDDGCFPNCRKAVRCRHHFHQSRLCCQPDLLLMLFLLHRMLQKFHWHLVTVHQYFLQPPLLKLARRSIPHQYRRLHHPRRLQHRRCQGLRCRRRHHRFLSHWSLRSRHAMCLLNRHLSTCQRKKRILMSNHRRLHHRLSHEHHWCRSFRSRYNHRRFLRRTSLPQT